MVEQKKEFLLRQTSRNFFLSTTKADVKEVEQTERKEQYVKIRKGKRRNAYAYNETKSSDILSRSFVFSNTINYRRMEGELKENGKIRGIINVLLLLLKSFLREEIVLINCR